jgi:uncharacterized protein YutE (UPF0331/DUF86 family)
LTHEYFRIDRKRIDDSVDAHLDTLEEAVSYLLADLEG